MECLPGDVELTRQGRLVLARCSPLANRGDLFRCQCTLAAPVGSLALCHGNSFALALSYDWTLDSATPPRMLGINFKAKGVLGGCGPNPRNRPACTVMASV
jgi:hypothetical protein